MTLALFILIRIFLSCSFASLGKGVLFCDTMSDSLQELEIALNQAGEENNLEQAREIRKQIVSNYPGTELAAESGFKLAVECLYKDGHIDEALELLEPVTQGKFEYWKKAARTTAGLCWRAKGETERSIQELKRVAFVDEPDEQSAIAMLMLYRLFDDRGDAKEKRRIEDRYRMQLKNILREAKSEGNATRQAMALIMLALADEYDGNEAESQAKLNEARALGRDAIGETFFNALSELDP